MKIVCATNMPFAREAFSTLGDVTLLEGRSIAAVDVRDTELLGLRSTTRVDRNLLEGSGVRFVGTATIGTDHMDTAYLEDAGITWCCAPGCNANSVSEYVTAALVCLASRHRFQLEGKTIGVVGVGNVGRRVVDKAHALGMQVLQNDPPRQRAEDPDAKVFVPLARLLSESDVVTLHVPLETDGPDPTAHLANESFFAALKPGAVFLNCARGGTTDTDALLAALSGGAVSHTVIDTWEGEPACRGDLLDACDLGTPHIAGHSFEGKANGTVMVYEAACRFLGSDPAWDVEPCLPDPVVPEVSVDAAGRSHEEVLWEVVRAVYDIEADDRQLRGSRGMDLVARAGAFDHQRGHYPVRREFRFTSVRLRNATDALNAKVAALGFGL